MNRQDYSDLIENAILFLFDINNVPNIQSILTSGQRRYFKKYFKINDQKAESFIVSGLSLDRVYAETKRDLMSAPANIIGDAKEAAYFVGSAIQWTKIVKIDAPNHLKYKRKPASVYEYHSRTIFSKELIGQHGQRFDPAEHQTVYQKEYLALDGNGLSIPYSIKGVKTICIPNDEILLFCSIIEDAYSTKCFRATIRDMANNIEMIFPVPVDFYKEMFALRDLESGSKKKIAHWVSKHLRTTVKSEAQIKSHIRGTKRFSFAGLDVVLIPNDDEKWWS